MRLGILVVVLAGSALVGCSLKRDVNKPGSGYFGSMPENSGRLIAPKMVKLTVAIIPRPQGDAVVNQAIWDLADEQSIGLEARRAIEANGIRVGIISGGLPPAVEATMKEPPPKKVDPAEFILPDASNTLVSLGKPQPSASLFLNSAGRSHGRDYKEASGWFRVTATQDGATGVSLRFSPEIHHGPMVRKFDASAPNGNGPMDFQLKDGQQEETLRDLAATLRLEPGQIAVIGCIPERKGSLGGFLFTEPEEKSDRVIQKVMLVWATRSSMDEVGSHPNKPSLLRPVEPPPPLPVSSSVSTSKPVVKESNP